MTYVFLMWAGLYFDVTESWVADAFELFDEDGDGTLSQVFAKPRQPAMHLPPADASKTIHRRTAVCAQEEFRWFYRAVLAQDDLIRLLAARDYYTAHTPTEEDLLPPSTLRWALKVIVTDSIYICLWS